MFSKPESRSYLILAGAALLLCVAAFCVTWILTEQTLHEPLRKGLPVVVKGTPKPTAPAPIMPPPPEQPRDRKSIDPEIQRMADELADRSQTPVRDLEIVNDFINLYSKVFQSNPIGGNEDITAALTGRNAKDGILFPPNNSMIVKGQLIDRWGTPYWFHPSSGYQMEIRSAGPDKNLFTPDDLVINPSPGNIGLSMSQP